MGPEFLSLTQAAGLVVTAFATAIAAMIVLALYSRRENSKTKVSGQSEVAFIFDGDTLVDATEAGRCLLDLTQSNGSDLIRLVSFLSPRFPDLRNAVMARGERGIVQMTSSDGQSRLCLQSTDNRLRLALVEIDQSAPAPIPDRHSLTALSDELKMHRAIGDGTPFPVWRQTTDGVIVWANAEYRALAGELGIWDAGTLMPPRIFRADPIVDQGKTGVQRTRLELPREAEPRWYEYQVKLVAADLLVAAIPVDRVVQAERSLNDFVQTLTQTFAHLNVGLAVFNRSRELAVFNPALTDLLELPAEFLITRPTLFQVFDKLREQRMMPEPKDYKTWRRQMSALEAAAADGVHSETWSLVDGRTYRVTGRPHPEGAVAFLFEDISAEISLERRFRSEVQLGQAVIDGLDEAIAVFLPSGELAMSNRAYSDLWNFDPSANDAPMTFLEASRNWQESCVATPVWGDARDFAATITERSNWTADIRLRDGRRLACRFDTMPGGCTLVGFSITRGLPLAQTPAIREPASA